MKIIGITGPTGSGKSLLCQFISESKLNIPCIDADEVYHSLLVPPSDCLDSIRKAFGKDVFLPDGSLDRKKLGLAVFSNTEKLELLNKTVLCHVTEEISHILCKYRDLGVSAVAIDAPTLIESGFSKECTAVVSVLAPEGVRSERIKERDHLTDELAQLRISAQKGEDFYIKNSDYVLINDGDAKEFEADAMKIIGNILNGGKDK